ncbi:MAG: hypothetical protein COB61_003565 [Thiotrichales bacterium]|nr:hypothetical protein [Thiotrichales bacterium]
MQQAYAGVENKISVSEFYITDFSIDAMHAAFLGKLDSRQQQFGFNKVMMINPPVRLYNSAQQLDQFLERNLPNRIENVGVFTESIFNRYAPIFNQSGGNEIDSEFLFALEERLLLTTEELETIIDLAFRLAASSMTFASDVMNHSGYIIHPDEQLTTGDTLTGYFKQSLHWGFTDYFDHILLPYVQQSGPGITIDSLKQRLSFKSIKNYLVSTKTIAVMTNSDDFINTKTC